MPIRFFCEHCRQMLKIGTSKTGCVVECPRCGKAVLVPSQSVPEAEQLYLLLKNKQPLNLPLPPSVQKLPPEKEVLASNIASEPVDSVEPESAQEELDGTINAADLDRWIDQLWITQHKQEGQAAPISDVPVVSADFDRVQTAYSTLQKRHQLMVTLLSAAALGLFVAGTLLGLFLRGSLLGITTTHARQISSDDTARRNEITGTLYYLNENGDRRADTDAVILCLPKDKQPSPLLSCQGLRPEETISQDTLQQIDELGGIYCRADVDGSFTLTYQEGVRYLVVMISSHQPPPGGGMKPSVYQDLHRYFYDAEHLSENCLETDEYEWSKHSFQYIFSKKP